MIKLYARYAKVMIFFLLALLLSPPLFAQQFAAMTPAQQNWQFIMGPTLENARAVQQKVEQQAQQQQQQQAAQQQKLQQMLDTMRTQLHEQRLLHTPVSTEPLFHPTPLPQTGVKNPWLKANPWGDSHVNPYKAKQYAPQPPQAAPKGVKPQQNQTSPPIYIQQQKSGNQPVNIFR